jgi:hypothetical protein
MDRGHPKGKRSLGALSRKITVVRIVTMDNDSTTTKQPEPWTPKDWAIILSGTLPGAAVIFHDVLAFILKLAGY